jgi:hypothetical protein
MIHVSPRVHMVHVEQALVGGAPVRLRGPPAHVADLLEQLLRGPQEPGPPEHGRVARERPVRPRGAAGELLPPRRGRGRVGGRRGEREREVLARDLSPASRQRVAHELRVRQRGAVRGVGRRRGGRVGVEGRRPGAAVRVRARGVVGREPQLLAPAVLWHVVELPRGLPQRQVVLVSVLRTAAPVSTARCRGHVVARAGLYYVTASRASPRDLRWSATACLLGPGAGGRAERKREGRQEGGKRRGSRTLRAPGRWLAGCRQGGSTAAAASFVALSRPLLCGPLPGPVV